MEAKLLHLISSLLTIERLLTFAIYCNCLKFQFKTLFVGKKFTSKQKN